MVVIRLSRAGSRKNPFYHIVVADRRMPRDGRFIEQLGYYNPMARGQAMRLQLEKERIHYWVSQGAIPSLRMTHLLKQLQKNPEQAQRPGLKKSELKKAQVKAATQHLKKAVPEEEASTKSPPESRAVAEKTMPEEKPQ
ncbi:MAG: 30S ribosomal protein S16 [Coxiella sp. RIFCSPHIGHO2_12_FULL_44_14]|nr:MAG: 30S ribosomal protein S16 [Coxiella sp. RIFCSPHIGHO2_12_FULL_44_14]